MRKLLVKVARACALLLCFGILLNIIAVNVLHVGGICGCTPEPPTQRIVSRAENQPLEPVIHLAIFLITDGQDRSASNLGDLRDVVARNGMDNVPVFAITFGDASRKQLQQIADFTSGAVFDGRSDLVGAFR